eukprot:97968_1
MSSIGSQMKIQCAYCSCQLSWKYYKASHHKTHMNSYNKSNIKWKCLFDVLVNGQMHKKGKVITGEWSLQNRKQYVKQYKLVHDNLIVKSCVKSQKKTPIKAVKIPRNVSV